MQVDSAGTIIAFSLVRRLGNSYLYYDCEITDLSNFRYRSCEETLPMRVARREMERNKQRYHTYLGAAGIKGYKERYEKELEGLFDFLGEEANK